MILWNNHLETVQKVQDNCHKISCTTVAGKEPLIRQINAEAENMRQGEHFLTFLILMNRLKPTLTVKQPLERLHALKFDFVALCNNTPIQLLRFMIHVHTSIFPVKKEKKDCIRK